MVVTSRVLESEVEPVPFISSNPAAAVVLVALVKTTFSPPAKVKSTSVLKVAAPSKVNAPLNSAVPSTFKYPSISTSGSEVDPPVAVKTTSFVPMVKSPVVVDIVCAPMKVKSASNPTRSSAYMP